jgi:hypothetical protein
VIWGASQIDDKSADDEADDEHDLEGGEDDFGLCRDVSVCFFRRNARCMRSLLLTSPNNLTPKKFRTTINTANMVIHAAGGTGVSQNCKIVAAALISVGTTMAIVYPGSKQVSCAHENAHRDDWRRGAVADKDVKGNTIPPRNQDVQKFHPTAAPSAGSTKCVAWRTNPPVLGMKVVISPVVYVTPKVIRPMKV